MVNVFKDQGYLVVFYNLRKPPLRALRTTLTSPGEFVLCMSEEEIYETIKLSKNGQLRLPFSNQNMFSSHPGVNHWLSKSVEC